MTDEKREALLRRCVKRLREDGYSYEQIPDHLESPHHPRLEPWEVYAYANPGKTASQVAAWKARHFPG
jgi:hypothetical protein